MSDQCRTAPPPKSSASSLVAPYDAITAISQRSLNAHLKRAFDATPLLQSASFRPAPEEEDDYSGFDVSFDAPKVELQLATENKIVALVLNIKGGDLKYLKISGQKVNEIACAVPPITITLDVNLISEEIPFAKLPEKIQTTFESSKELQIRRTLLDFKNASLARLRKSQTTLYSVIEDITQIALISGYVDKYLKQLAEKQDELVFHYVATAPSAAHVKENYVLPSIVPTSESGLQNLPAANDGTSGVSHGDDSLLVYLHTSEGRVLPRAQLAESAKAIIEVGKAAETPVAVISRAKFLDAVILARLAEVNKQSTWIVDTASVEATLKPPSVKYSLTGHLGWTDASADQVAFTPVDAASVSEDIRAKVQGTGVWYRYRKYDHKDKTSAVVFKVSQSATTENWLFVPEGLDTDNKATISIFGSTKVDFQTKLDINTSIGYVLSEWSTSITLDSSKPGKPVIFTTEEAVRPRVSDKVTAEATLHAGELAEEVLKPARILLEEFAFSLQDVSARITDAFRMDWPFFIPSIGGNMFVNKAFFCSGLDLVCDLQKRSA